MPFKLIMIIKQTFFVFFTLLNLLGSFAQEDTIYIPKIEIIAGKAENNHLQSINSLYLDEVRIQIKSYANITSSLSLRNFKSEHTKILIFDTPITLGGMGMFDMFLAPLEVFDFYNIISSQKNIELNSGAFGGIIELNDYMTRKEINSHTISFNSNKTVFFKNINQFSNANFSTTIASAKVFSENQYKYYNPFLDTLNKKKDAWFNKDHILWTSSFKFSKNDKLIFKYLKSVISRSFPSPLTYQGSKRKENEDFTQQIWALEYATNLKKTKIKLYLSRLNQNSFFHLKVKDINWVEIINTNWQFNSTFFKLRLRNSWYSFNYNFLSDHYTLNSIKPHSFSLDKTRILHSLVFKPKELKNEALSFSTVQKLDFTLSNIQYLFYYQLKTLTNPCFSINISQNINYPSLNDLYWIPGGNNKLLPEKSREFKVFSKFFTSINNTQFLVKTEFFSAKVRNWILWKPTQYHYWTAQNISSVLNNSLIIELYVFFNNFLFDKFKISYQYASVSDSTNLQLIYVPKHRIISNLAIKLWQSKLVLSSIYESKRFVLIHNQDFFLEPYTLFFLSWVKNIRLKTFSIKLKLEINNLFNTRYMLVVNREQPLRSYIFSIDISK